MNIIETHTLAKTFVLRQGKGGPAQQVEAVRGISFAVRQGEIFGFLGPNGAGKSTTQRMLATLIPPSSGGATVAGFDLAREPGQVRKHIGYVGQAGGADDAATARDNLLLQARLYGLSGAEAKKRSEALIEALQLAEFANRPMRTCSGGQRRRLDIALAMVHQPRLLFLDEPTSGLDPQARAHLWEEIRGLREGGSTVFLTTHYLDEADILSDRLVIIDHGQIVAEGSPAELKRQISGDIISLGLDTPDDGLSRAGQMIEARPYVRGVASGESGFQITVQDGEAALPDLLRLANEEGWGVTGLSLARPSLADVFLRQTGRSLRENAQN